MDGAVWRFYILIINMGTLFDITEIEKHTEENGSLFNINRPGTIVEHVCTMAVQK